MRPGDEVAHDRRKVERRERRHGRWDRAEDRTDHAALLERVDTETSEAFEAVREIELEILLELLLLSVRQDAVEQTLRVIGRQLREFGRREPAVDAEHG